LFFRTCALLALDIKPVFVLDGDAPSLKSLTLGLRRAAETGGEAKQQQDLSRRRLKSVQSECRYLLSALGLECVQASGEGEALCAAFDSAGMVDGVFTEDSDAFCYGARVILRGLSVAAKTYSVDRISSKDVAEKLGLSRDRILFMAVMLGKNKLLYLL
jgi:5'-3' exonuclease